MVRDPSFELLVAASSLIDGLAAMALLWGPDWGRSSPEPRAGSSLPAIRLTLSRVALAAVGVAGLFLIKLVVLHSGLGVGMFGVIRLVYVDLVVVLPLLGALALAGQFFGGPRARCSRPVLALAAVSLLAAPLGFYGTYIEPYRLQLDEATMQLPDGRAGTEPLRIGVLADLQTSRVTEYEYEAVRRLMEQEPDLILIPGDIFQGTIPELEAELPALRELLAGLTAPGGVYLVQGNVDWTSHRELLVEGTGIELLVDQIRRIEVQGRKVTLGGVGLSVHRGSTGKEVVTALESAPGSDDIRVLLGHYPDWLLQLQPDSRIDLFVAGHTHGGQVRIPFFGPLITFTRVPRHIAGGGLHELDGRRVYVSRGVGLERGQSPRLRFNCPPCVSLLTME